MDEVPREKTKLLDASNAAAATVRIYSSPLRIIAYVSLSFLIKKRDSWLIFTLFEFRPTFHNFLNQLRFNQLLLLN